MADAVAFYLDRRTITLVIVAADAERGGSTADARLTLRAVLSQSRLAFVSPGGPIDCSYDNGQMSQI